MSVPRTRIAACVAAVAASVFLFADATHAQPDCAQVMNQALNSVRAFNEEAKKQSMDFAVDTTVDVALGDARKMLTDHTAPSQASARQMELHKTKIETWESIQKAFGVTIEELYACITPGARCSLQDFVKKQNEAFQRWMQTFSSESTQGAHDRVGKARDLLQNNVKQLAGNATGSMTAAVSCMDQHIKAGSTADAVDARTPATAPRTAAKGGGGAGTALKVGAVVGVAAVGGIFIAKELDNLKNDLAVVDPPSNNGGSGGSSNAFDGSYGAQASYSCSTSAGASEPCNRSFGGGGCAFESFSFTVSGGVVRDQCWLSASAVSSSGFYSGRYSGAGSMSMPVTGTFTTSFQLIAAEVYRGNTYRITINVQKR